MSADKKHSAEIRLLGQRIAIKSKETDPELVDEVVELVARLIRNAEMRSKSAAAHQVAILALLDLAEEYVQAKRRTVQYKKQVDSRQMELLEMIEAESK